MSLESCDNATSDTTHLDELILAKHAIRSLYRAPFFIVCVLYIFYIMSNWAYRIRFYILRLNNFHKKFWYCCREIRWMCLNEFFHEFIYVHFLNVFFNKSVLTGTCCKQWEQDEPLLQSFPFDIVLPGIHKIPENDPILQTKHSRKQSIGLQPVRC